MGQIVGQPMGGLLSYPAKDFKIFDTPFWREYPFSLPCFVAALLAVIGVVFAFFFAEEVRTVWLISFTLGADRMV